MKYFVLFLLLYSLSSCDYNIEINTGDTSREPKTNFSQQEQNILQVARKIIDSAYYCTLISQNDKHESKARIMEPFQPEKDFTIFLATNPKSRKVKEIKNNPKVTLHYFNKKAPAYVSLYGTVQIIENDSLKQAYWKKGWEHFYNNRKDAYLLLRFIPDYLELISIPDAYTGDAKTWMPAWVYFYKN